MSAVLQTPSPEVAFKAGDAASYDTVAEDFDRLTHRYSAAPTAWLLDLLDAPPGTPLLDVGTGTGVVAAAARQRGLPVVGADLSISMLARARRTLVGTEPTEPRVDFLAADAEDLAALADGSFTAAVSLFALLHLPNPERALAALHRVLALGGRLVVAVGSGPSRLTPAGLVDGAARLADRLKTLLGRRLESPALIHQLMERHLPAVAEDPEAPLARQHRNRSRVVPAMVRAAGFREVRVHWRGWSVEVPAIDAFWALQTAFSSAARKRLAAAPADARKALRDDFFNHCRRVLARGGRLVYPHAALAVVARR